MKADKYLPSTCPFCHAPIARTITIEGHRIYTCGTVGCRDSQTFEKRCKVDEQLDLFQKR